MRDAMCEFFVGCGGADGGYAEGPMAEGLMGRVAGGADTGCFCWGCGKTVGRGAQGLTGGEVTIGIGGGAC